MSSRTIIRQCGQVRMSVHLTPVEANGTCLSRRATVTAWRDRDPSLNTGAVTFDIPYDPAADDVHTHVAATALALMLYNQRTRARMRWTPEPSDLEFTRQGLSPYPLIHGVGGDSSPP